MFCVSLMEQTHSEIREAMESCQANGAQLVEIRLDALTEPLNSELLFSHSTIPTIATYRRACDGGLYKGDENDRLDHLVQACEAGATYVDIEIDCADSFAQVPGTKRIVSHHLLDHTPDDLDEWQTRFAQTEADIHKFVTFAKRPTDAFRVLRFGKGSQTPTICLGMGPYGAFSRLLTLRQGAPWTYVAHHPHRPAAPGQFTLKMAQDWLGGRTVNAATRVFGVVGDPIQQSLSPHLHNGAFQALNINAIYVPFHVPSGDFKTFLESAHQYGVEGLSVTLPHKREAFLQCTSNDETAETLEVSNTLLRTPNGWHAHNTDGPAAMKSISQVVESAHGQGYSNLEALILGSGGVARTVGTLLKQEGAKLVISSRNETSGRTLAAEFGCQWIPWEQRTNTPFSLLVNATSVGMSPHGGQSPFPQEDLPAHAAVYDAVYWPSPTRLVNDATALGLSAVDGIPHFLDQAAAQCEFFTRGEAPVQTMTKILHQALRQKERAH